ncbi:MAG: response regulator, partial [Thermodesulfobacteriota bacterium]
MRDEKLRVLYVEDNPADADLARRELGRLAPGIELEVAETLAAARERLGPPPFPFDVLLTDLGLPDGSGLELLAEVGGSSASLPVVILTGSGDQEAAVAALKAGAEDYLVKKPGHPAELPRVLAEARDRFRTRRERRSRPLRVLYAEPNDFDVDLTRRYLTQHASHIHLEVVTGGAEVLARLPGSTQDPLPWDVVLLDYRLPGLDALEVVKALRQERGLTVPIVLVTGQGTEEVAVEALRLGAQDYVVKRPGYLTRLPVVLENVQKQAELRRAEARYRNLFSSLRDVVIVADEARTIVDANQPALRTVFGYETHEVLGRQTSVLYGSQEEFARTGREVFDRREPTAGQLLEVRFRRKCGEVFAGELFALKLHDDQGQPAGNIGVIRDITQRRRADEALRASEAEFRRLSQEFQGLLDGIPDGLMLLDPKLRVLWANRAAARAVATEPQTMVGQRCHELWYGRARACEPCPILRSFASGTPHEDVLSSPDGRAWEVRTMPLAGADGRVEKVICVKRDVTAHHRLEDQLRQAQKMEAVGRLAGGVAHDFNNLLTVVNGLAELAAGDLEPGHPLLPRLQGILDAGSRAARLTHQLLAFARQQVVAPRALDLNEAVGALHGMLQRLIGEDIELRWKPGADVWRVYLDPGQVDQILANLAVNARDAIPGTGTVTVETSNAVLDEAWCEAHPGAAPGEHAVLQVTDTGAGMDQGTLAHIFEPFFTTKEPGKGTGLGLATVYGIVKQAGGAIYAYSEPGHGTTFRIYLPRWTGGGEAAVVRDVPAAPPPGTETVLLVEDEEAILALGQAILERQGYRVLTAQSPAEALELAAREPGEIHLLATDVVMPGMNGR